MDTKTDNLTSLTDLAKILSLTRSQITTKVDKGEIPVVIVGGRMMVESTAVASVIPEKTQFEKMTGRRFEDLPRLLTVDQTAAALGRRGGSRKLGRVRTSPGSHRRSVDCGKTAPDRSHRGVA